MSWSIEEHIGECRPFPAQVVVYKGETGECLAYVSGEVADRLKAENTKLRELVTELHFLITDERVYVRYECESWERRLDAVEKDMRELGVKVDG